VSWQIERLQQEGFAEAVDFINYVFSQTYGPHDFETLLPKLYRPEPELVRCHWVVREHGALVALAGVYPMTWQVGGSVLRVAGIGAVATHPRHRGRGLMRAVVGHGVAEARADGCHLSWLDGLGHRYRHLGYERAGAEISFVLSARDFSAAGVDGTGLSFRRLNEGDALLEQAARLHACQRVHWRRPPAPPRRHRRQPIR
jgi:predicted acetyltransferase